MLSKFAADCGKVISRRQFLKLGAVVGLAGSVPLASAHTAFNRELQLDGERRLRLVHTRTGESLNVTYWEKGEYLRESLADVSRFLRDYRTDDVKPIQPALLDLLHGLHKRLDSSDPFQIVCGYRSPETNQSLRAHSHRVAKHSLHMEGRAVDLRLPNRSLRDVRNAAVAMQQGGVGYYASSDFVHVDVGDVRTW